MCDCKNAVKEGKAKPDTPIKSPKKTCPKKLIEVKWNKEKAFCGDDAALLGKAENYDPNTAAVAKISGEKGVIDKLKGQGQNTFNMPWSVKNVLFQGDAMPEKYDIVGELSAGGQTVNTQKPLEVQRVPDKGPELCKFSLTAKNQAETTTYSWEASFNLSIKKDKLHADLVFQIKKAWLGKWVSFDSRAAPAGDGMSGWAFIKKDGANWKYWKKSTKRWVQLPRGINKYTVNDIVFIKKAAKFVGREDATSEWPETFPEPADYEQMKTKWLDNFHSEWDNKFNLKRKACKSTSTTCCSWQIRIKAKWSDDPGNALVYAVWAQAYEQSNSEDWYLSDPDVSTGGHEGGHLLGAYDEYAKGALDPATKKIDASSIMGVNLTKAHARLLNNFRDHAKKKINNWTGRSWDFEIKKV